MASFRRHGDGWRAEVFRRGVRRSQVFDSKGAAVGWAGTVEAEIMAGVRGEVPNLTVRDLLERYGREVSAGKKGKRWEQIRLEAIGRDPLADVRLRQLDSPHAAAWQERRLKAVAAASARRERNLLNNAFEIARKEWKWLRKNPFEGVRRPKDGKARSRIATKAELSKLSGRASTSMKRVLTIALETGMRASEIASNPVVMGRVAYLLDSKNGEAREVPLSKKAVKALSGGPIDLTAGSISEIFGRYCEEEAIDGLTFHDLRHTAATRIAKRLDLMDLCKMFGWKDPRHALRYYNEGTAAIADKL